MDTEKPNEQQGSSDSGSSGQDSQQPSDSTPNDDVQAPQSSPIVKGNIPDSTPNDSVEAPKSHRFTEGFGYSDSDNE